MSFIEPGERPNNQYAAILISVIILIAFIGVVVAFR
jgi:hypothetical protein